jgi:hypothetical protein
MKKKTKKTKMSLKGWVHSNLRTIIITSFLIPILLVAFVSIAHVTTWYEISNPVSWAIYLSAAIEIAALGALAGLSVNMGRFIYVPFGIVTLIQFIGNIFFSFSFIDVNSKMFQDWVLMVGPVFEPMGVESNDLTAHRRILSFFAGGFLPLISLTFAHMLVKFSEESSNIEETKPEVTNRTTTVKNEIKKNEVEIKEISEDEIEKLSKEAGKLESNIIEEPYRPSQEDLERLQSELNKILSKKNEIIEEVVENIEQDSIIKESESVQTEEPKINRLTYLPRNVGDTQV